MDKDSILKNYKFVLLDNETGHFLFLKDDKEVQRVLDSEEIFDKDILIKLSKDNVRIAVRKDFILLE